MARRSQEANYGFPPARGGRGAPSMFPRKLFQILCETDPAVVGWDSDGKSFHIVNFEEFIEGVMPLFYRHNKLTSFQRQLNLYGFKKMGRDEKFPGHYYHPSFQRDHPEILGGVRRSYPVTSPKWEDDGSVASPEDEAAAVVAAAEGSQGSSASPRRKRVARSPTRKMDGSEKPAVGREDPPQHQQHQHPQQHQRVRHTPANDDEHGLLPPAPLAFDDGGGSGGGAEHETRRGGGEDLEESRGGGSENAMPRKKPAHRPWFYSGSPALSSAAATARLDGQPQKQRGAKTESMVEDDVDVYTGPGRASEREVGVKAVGGEGEVLNRRDSPYASTGGNGGGGGRRWTYYQEDPYLASGGGGGGGGWYDSEESSLSRLNSCDSVYSAWDDAQQPGGGQYYGRGRTRAVPASGMAMGPEGENRRSRYPPETGGVIGRSSGARPVHRAVPTSAMFPAHFLRHERFGSYQGPHYPPPPAYLPAHTYPDPDAAPLKPSRWRPVYNGGGGGGVGGGGRNGEDGWGGSERRLSDGKSAAAWGPDAYGADEEREALAASGRGSKTRGAVAAKANGPAVAGREEGVTGGGDPQGYSHPSASSYRAACDDFLGEDGGQGAESSDRAARFRFSDAKPGAGVAPGSSSAPGGAREDGVDVRSSSRVMAATV